MAEPELQLVPALSALEAALAAYDRTLVDLRDTVRAQQKARRDLARYSRLIEDIDLRMIQAEAAIESLESQQEDHLV